MMDVTWENLMVLKMVSNSDLQTDLKKGGLKVLQMVPKLDE
jgi:hypothetical protein